MGTSEKASELLARLDDEIADLKTSDGWTRYLQMQARLHHYSANNVMLIHLQRPDATHVMGFRGWQRINRLVKKGEKGIGILVPWTGKRVLEPVDENDKSVTQRFTYFRIGYVFDLAQTDGDAMTEWAFASGLVESDEAIITMTRLLEERGFSVSREPMASATRGYCDPTAKRVVLREDLNAANTVAVLAHELAHALLHSDLTDYRENRPVRECEAESVAYVVGTALGINMAGCALPYLAIWSSRDDDAKTITAAAKKVQATASTILDALGIAGEEVAA